MEYLTRFIKGDIIQMDNKEFKLLSNGYYSAKHNGVVCDVENGVVSYMEMMEKDAKIISYEKKFRNL
jgi:hypothetical protein